MGGWRLLYYPHRIAECPSLFSGLCVLLARRARLSLLVFLAPDWRLKDKSYSTEMQEVNQFTGECLLIARIMISLLFFIFWLGKVIFWKNRVAYENFGHRFSLSSLLLKPLCSSPTRYNVLYQVLCNDYMSLMLKVNPLHFLTVTQNHSFQNMPFLGETSITATHMAK